jgi:hypothetical protein
MADNPVVSGRLGVKDRRRQPAPAAKRHPSSTSHFVGVHLAGRLRARPWMAMARLPGPGHVYLGAWQTEREAAEAYDRAVLYYRGPRGSRNFPREPFVPADVRSLQVEARARGKQLMSSSFHGVAHVAPSWIAQLKVHGRHISLGHWPTEIAAAEAYDRGARFCHLDTRTLNFPGRRLKAAAPAELRRAARLARKAERATSRYRGVFMAARETPRPWLAQLTVQRRRTVSLGTWETERDAARAYDRAARYYRLPKSVFNFPAEKLAATSPPVLVSEARREGKRRRTSRYIGVSWSAAHGQWHAQISHLSRNMHLGLFTDERKAAEAYDAKAIALRGPRAQINFHPETGRAVIGQRLGDLLSTTSPARRSRQDGQIMP